MSGKIIEEKEDIYHASKAWSSTVLRKAPISMRHVFTAWEKSEDVVVTEAMEEGRLYHSLLLEQNIADYVARPLNEKGELIRSNSKEYATFLAANPALTPIRPELFNNMYSALTAFTENKIAMRMIKDARIEHSVYATDHETGLAIKARPDVLGSNYIIDLKSTLTIDRNFEKNIFANGYDFQLAHYGETVLAATGQYINEYFILAFERKAPFASKIFRVPIRYINEAKKMRRQYLNEIAICVAENSWPSFREEIIDAVRPAFLEQSTDISFEGVG